MNQRGFTLLELLIAIALFSLLGLACYQLLERTQRSDQTITRHEVQLRQLQRALGTIERDLQQAIAAPLSRDPARASALIGTTNELYLTRSGWSNPLDQPRSDLLEVRHTWQNGEWRREAASPPHQQSELDDQQNAASAPSQRLLAGVTLKQLHYIDIVGQPHSNWPLADAPLALPMAIEVVIDAPGLPDIRRVILLPGQQFTPGGGAQ
jgi:general secretion pathway protein J